MLIDTHAHYDDAAFDADREQLIEELNKKNIIAVNVGATKGSALTALDFSGKYKNIYATLGVHPDEVAELNDDDMQYFLELSKDKKVVAIGEIGLDYHWNVNPREVQKEWFIKQIHLAQEAQLPVNIHSRDAAQDTLDTVKRENAGKFGGIVHCYSYGVELAREYMKLGFHFGIGGVITYKNAKTVREVVDYLPIDRIVLETDSPYLAPAPHRGERNDSRNLPFVAAQIGLIKGLSPEEVIEITAQNARTVYARLG
ncbi:MAG: TatD family hydrolase [Lachnospiraceae bacterium]|nr:TatD family hydrolase [Lachnospiraceae bacterium]